MFRFTIRDLLWLTVVVALAVAWWVDRYRTNKAAYVGAIATTPMIEPTADPLSE